VKGPGIEFFEAIRRALGALPLIAEDLGHITDEVVALRDAAGLSGMKVLQFAFDGNPDNPYLPYNVVADSVIYTGTHDNDTTVGWFTNAPAAPAWRRLLDCRAEFWRCSHGLRGAVCSRSFCR
jgi:4-alpha-glucanotransferase